MKRIFLFLATNLAVMLVLSTTLRLLGIDSILNANGLDTGALLVFSLLAGFTGSIISLLMSKTMARLATGARVIGTPRGADEAWLLTTVRRLAQEAGIGEPQVAVYEGAPNAFATGASRDASLVAVSTGLLQSMSEQEAEAVLGHEVSHIANGDMVTLALVQGVVNTFVIFFARIVGWFVDQTLFRRDDDAYRGGTGPGYYVTVMVCEILFGVVASMIVAWFSRQREFRADAGSARLLGTPAPMIAALSRLEKLQPGVLPQALRTFGITDQPAWLGLFASHPPVQQRLAALQAGWRGHARASH